MIDRRPFYFVRVTADQLKVNQLLEPQISQIPQILIASIGDESTSRRGQWRYASNHGNVAGYGPQSA